MSATALELGQEPTLTPEERAERFPKATEIRGESVLSVSDKVLDRTDELPDSVKVTSFKTKRHPWSRTKGVKLPKPADRDHYRVEDAVRQLTQPEKGFRITGRNESGSRIRPIVVFVDPESRVPDQAKMVFSTIADREARPLSRSRIRSPRRPR